MLALAGRAWGQSAPSALNVGFSVPIFLMLYFIGLRLFSSARKQLKSDSGG